jgi:hypothetical protein
MMAVNYLRMAAGQGYMDTLNYHNPAFQVHTLNMEAAARDFNAAGRRLGMW